MKGDPKLLATLNKLLADELTAINQYMVHSEMCDSWGYERLHKKIEERAIQEMRHAEKLIARILFLEGIPKVDKLNRIHVGSDVPKQLASDLQAEIVAWKAYNAAIQLANKVGDAPTRALFDEIIRDEDDHIDWIEEQQDQIKHMGIGLYLSRQGKE